ncbi:MAG: peptidylprolyl isomerase [Gemmataceae bacterium]
MRELPRVFCAFGLWLIVGNTVYAQSQPPKAPASASIAKSPDANAVAARVNNQVIAEVAVQRALKRVPPDKQDLARPEILDYLIDNLLIDQYLAQMGETVDKKEIESKVKLIHEEIERKHENYAKVMKELMLSEPELRTNIEAELRWTQYTDKQAIEERLKKLFDSEHEMFDGSMIRARHILRPLESKSKDAKGDPERAKLLQIKKQIEDQVALGLSKLPADADKLKREKTRQELLDQIFSDFARKESVCPATKDIGGDLQWFPRGGSMVESFAKAAFAAQPFQMTDVVQTQFGYHLILVTDRKPGREVTFDDVKEEVKEVFCSQLHDRLVARLRPTAKITIASQGKSSEKAPAKGDVIRN